MLMAAGGRNCVNHAAHNDRHLLLHDYSCTSHLVYDSRHFLLLYVRWYFCPDHSVRHALNSLLPCNTLLIASRETLGVMSVFGMAVDVFISLRQASCSLHCFSQVFSFILYISYNKQFKRDIYSLSIKF